MRPRKCKHEQGFEYWMKNCGFYLRRTVFFSSFSLLSFLVDCVSLTKQPLMTRFFLVHLHFRHFLQTKFVFYDEILTTFSTDVAVVAVVVTILCCLLWVVCLGHLSHRLYILRVFTSITKIFSPQRRDALFFGRPFAKINWWEKKHSHRKWKRIFCLFWFTWIYVTLFFRLLFCVLLLPSIDQNYIQCVSDFFLLKYT